MQVAICRSSIVATSTQSRASAIRSRRNAAMAARLPPVAFDTLLVAPGLKPNYYGFFFEGARRLLGPRAVRWSADFPALGKGNGMAIRALGPGIERRIYVDARDNATHHKPAFEWCDVYGS